MFWVIMGVVYVIVGLLFDLAEPEQPGELTEHLIIIFIGPLIIILTLVVSVILGIALLGISLGERLGIIERKRIGIEW